MDESTQNFGKMQIVNTQRPGRCKPGSKMIAGKGLCCIKHATGYPRIEWYLNGVFVPDGHKKYAHLFRTSF